MKKKFVFVLIGVIIVALISLLIISLTKNGNKDVSLFRDVIKKKAQNKEDILVYVYYSRSECSYCKDTRRYIDLYESKYQLGMIYYDKNKNSSDDYKEMEEYFNLESNYVTPPAIIMVKDGELVAVVNENHYESELKEFLVNYGFLDKKELNVERQVRELDDFYEITSSDKPMFVVFYNYDNSGYFNI